MEVQSSEKLYSTLGKTWKQHLSKIRKDRYINRIRYIEIISQFSWFIKVCRGVLGSEKTSLFVDDDDRNKGHCPESFDGKSDRGGGKKDGKNRSELRIVSEIKEKLKEDCSKDGEKK